MSHDERDRNMISTVQMVIVYLGIIVMSYVTPIVLTLWGGYNSQGAWGKITTIYAVLCTVLIMAIGIFVKEKEVPEEIVQSDAEEKERLGIWKLLKELFSCKYTWILMCLLMFYYLNSGVAGIATYYWTYVFGSFELQGIASVASMPLTILVLLLTPQLLKKIEREKLVMIGLVIVAVSKILSIIFARNMLLFVIFYATATIGLCPMMSLAFIFNADLVDYFIRKKGLKIEGLASATYSIGIKVGTGIGSAVVGWGLTLIGFNSAQEIQSVFTQNGIIFINSGTPLFSSSHICLLLWKYRHVRIPAKASIK